jgi:predicted  nucleic acid-binding Zn-ribbon protein
VVEAASAVEAALAQARTRRELLAAQLEPSLRASYESARQRVKDPVVPVVDIGTCGGCRVLIAAAELEHARAVADRDLVCCPGCGRYLAFGVG